MAPVRLKGVERARVGSLDAMFETEFQRSLLLYQRVLDSQGGSLGLSCRTNDVIKTGAGNKPKFNQFVFK